MANSILTSSCHDEQGGNSVYNPDIQQMPLVPFPLRQTHRCIRPARTSCNKGKEDTRKGSRRVEAGNKDNRACGHVSAAEGWAECRYVGARTG